MQKVIEVEEGRSVNFKASAFSPIAYNRLFPGKDFLRDMDKLHEKNKEMEKEKDDSISHFDMQDYELFVRIAYTFAYQGLAPSPRETEEQREFTEKYRDALDWIDTFDTFSIYLILPEIMELWYKNNKTVSDSKNPVPAPPEK
ncbi:hypothetical protein C817_02572 [Dorea sp. 5-2]|nr:hypothetical protein C817_02572 [Dorea sp. 5-2]